MNKYLKKGLLFGLLALLVAFVLPIRVNASTTDATGTSKWEEKSSNTMIKNVNGADFIHTEAFGNAYTGSTSYAQHINVLKMKTDGVSTKLVTWGVQGDNKNYKLSTLTDIAKNYEETHPGWIVLGGTNGDQYYFQHGTKRAEDGSNIYMPQPYYPLIMDYEARFAYTSYGVSSSNYVGFSNNGTLEAPSEIAGLVLSILDENDLVVEEIMIDNVNKNAGSNQTSVWYPLESASKFGESINVKVTSSNDLYIIEDAIFAYASNSTEYTYNNGDKGVNAYFGKGYISTTSKEVLLKEGMFAIETTNETVKAALATGKKVMVDYKYVNESMNNCESVGGYHSIHMLDGKEITDNSAYNTKHYSRSLFGITEDGEYALVTADINSQYKGLNMTEANAVLKHYGLVSAYQCDGGGSVTAIARNADGTFRVVNNPQYTNERTNLTGMLFVARVPELNFNEDLSTRNEIIFDFEDNDKATYISNIYIEHNGNKYQLENNQIKVTDLEEDKEYDFKVTFEVVDRRTNKKTTVSQLVKGRTKAFEIPESPYEVKEVGKDYIKIIKNETETSSWFESVTVELSGTKYLMTEDELLIEGLISGTSYQLKYIYSVIDPVTNNKYTGEETIEEKIVTKEYSLPIIEEFVLVDSTNTVSIKYSYDDDDDVIESIYMVCVTNNEQVELTRSRGTIKFENLDKSVGEYIFKIIIKTKYTNSSGEVEEDEVESEEIKVIFEQDAPVEPEQPKKGCKKSSAYIFVSALSTLSLAVLVLKKKN